MKTIGLRLGAIAPESFHVQRSGFRWLCENGQHCHAGEAIAYCNIGVVPPGQTIDAVGAFQSEHRDFQAAIVLTVAGRVWRQDGASLGGQLDQLGHFLRWNPDEVFAALHPDDAVQHLESTMHRVLLAAGRRFTEFAEVRSGLLSGWHERSRAWWCDGDGVDGTLLALGSCELTATVRGERTAFVELLARTSEAAQIVLSPDDLLVPCARVCLEQMRRTEADATAIAADMAATLPRCAEALSPVDWFFAGTLLRTLQRSPIIEGMDVMTRSGISRVQRPDAILMSLIAEPRRIFRHRRLGYTICLHVFRIAETSEVIRAWFRAHFEPVDRDAADIFADWQQLIREVRGPNPLLFMVMNVVSTSASEDFLNYRQFDLPMARSISSVHRKEMNLMLHDLARAPEVAIIDVDAMAAEMGATFHVPDGVHLSGAMQRQVRQEVLGALVRHQVPGFGRSSLR